MIIVYLQLNIYVSSELCVCVSVVSLQSLNLTLQTQLNERNRELENLQKENQELRQAVEDRDNDLRETKEQCELETSRIRMGKKQEILYIHLLPILHK